MSLFDFLTNPQGDQAPPPVSAPQFMPQQGAPSQAAMGPQAAAPQGLLGPDPHEPDAPTPEHHGLLGRFAAADDSGVSMADRLFAVGAILHGDSEMGMKYLQTKQAAGAKAKTTAEAAALKAKGNRAFKAAYQNGKFDAGAYASVMGDDLDPLSMAKVVKAYAPEGGVSGDFGYAKDPVTGTISWQGERPQGYGEVTSAANSAETMRHNHVTEEQGAGHLTVSQAQAALARQREGRLGAKGAGGAPSWLPPGARVVHVPGT